MHIDQLALGSAFGENQLGRPVVDEVLLVLGQARVGTETCPAEVVARSRRGRERQSLPSVNDLHQALDLDQSLDVNLDVNRGGRVISVHRGSSSLRSASWRT